jgi:hypothetical protein
VTEPAAPSVAPESTQPDTTVDTVAQSDIPKENVQPSILQAARRSNNRAGAAGKQEGVSSVTPSIENTASAVALAESADPANMGALLGSIQQAHRAGYTDAGALTAAWSLYAARADGAAISSFTDFKDKAAQIEALMRPAAAEQPAPMPVQEAAAQIKKSLASGVEAFHGGSLPDEITEVRAFGGLHAGTQRAAQERVGRPSTAADTANVSRIVVKASNPYLPQGRVLDESNGTDRTQLFLIQQLPEERQKLIDAGFDVVPYRNAVEDPGSLSYLVLDPRGYTKRGDHTPSPPTPPPNAPAAVSKR